LHTKRRSTTEKIARDQRFPPFHPYSKRKGKAGSVRGVCVPGSKDFQENPVFSGDHKRKVRPPLALPKKRLPAQRSRRRTTAGTPGVEDIAPELGRHKKGVGNILERKRNVMPLAKGEKALMQKKQTQKGGGRKLPRKPPQKRDRDRTTGDPERVNSGLDNATIKGQKGGPPAN